MVAMMPSTGPEEHLAVETDLEDAPAPPGRLRSRRVVAEVLTVVLVLAAAALVAGTTRGTQGPAAPPAPRDRFAGTGGWITFNRAGLLFAMDPDHPSIRVDLGTSTGLPVGWSADGSELLLHGSISDPNDRSLAVLHADGTVTSLVHGRAFGPGISGAISPDGAWVVYADAGSLHEVAASGGMPSQLFPARDVGALGSPTVSPDGSTIAFFDGAGDAVNSIRVVNASGTVERVLVDRAVLRHAYDPHALQWSPDGSRLLFQAGTGSERIHDEIFTVRADGSGLRGVAAGTDPAWSPDGARISFNLPNLSTVDGSRDPIVIANADGSDVRRTGAFGVAGAWNPAPAS